MEKELFIKSALCECVESVLENVMAEQVLLGAIMELQTDDAEDLRQESVKGVVDDLHLLQEKLTELNGLTAELRKAAVEEDAIGLDESDNSLLEVIDAAIGINEGSEGHSVLGDAVGLFEATSVEQLYTAQARATVADLAHLCSAFVQLRAEFSNYFDVAGLDTSDVASGNDE